MDVADLKKTPLYDAHVRAGGKIVPFAGFLMPVTFEGIVAEHARVRTKVGLFDVSHMGEIFVTGGAAADFTDRMVTNNVAKLVPGQVCYTVACNAEGKVLDDLLVHKFSEERILLVVNAVNVDKIYRHFHGRAPRGVEVTNLTPAIGQIAVQGPKARALMERVAVCKECHVKLPELEYYHFMTYRWRGAEVVLARTGYTGEHGYELYLPAALTTEVWNELLEKGQDLGVAPIGLGARDTLRFEPCFCLYGHELDEGTSPLEAGLSWLVKLNKESDFLGKTALVHEKERGSARMLAGFEMMGRAIARQGFSVLYDGRPIGKVSSGTFAPTLQKSLALALVESAAKGMEGDFAVDVRGRIEVAKMRPMPFYPSRAGE